MTEKLTPEEASAAISALVKEAKALISKAETIANSSGVGFSLAIGGYGMGGYYQPELDESDPDWVASEGGWQASSQSC